MGMGINMNVNAQPGYGQQQPLQPLQQPRHDKKGKNKKHDDNFGQPQSAQINMGFGGMPGVSMNVQQTGFDQQGFGQPGQPQQASVNMNMGMGGMPGMNMNVQQNQGFGQPQNAQINMGMGGMPGVNMTVQQQGFGQPGQQQQVYMDFMGMNMNVKGTTEQNQGFGF